MNILMVNYEYPPLGGGGGVFNKQLAEALSKNNNITVITSRFGDQKPYELINNVEIIRVPVLMRGDQNAATIVSMLCFFPTSLWAGNKLLKKRSFDVIHSLFAIPSAPSGLALAKKFHIPHILSVLGGDIYDPSKKLSPHKAPVLHQTVKKVIEESDRVVALSSDIKNRASKYYNVSSEIQIIHLGIPKPCFVKKDRDYFNFKPDEILLVTVGRLVPRKSLQDLIKAVHELNAPNIRLLLIGDGPEKPKLEALARSLSITEKVLFLGYVSNEKKFQLMSVSDIYVSSSQHEGFGIVFLEAMASGLPIVSYDQGGQSDFLVDNTTGFLVNYEFRHELTEKIRKLCEHKLLRKQMSEFNRQYIKKFYIEICANHYRFLYQTVCEKSVSNNLEP